MFVVAEVGSNWRDLGDLKHSIGMAAVAGADAVKLQWLKMEDLYGYRANTHLDRYRLHEDHIAAMAEYAHDCGIEFMVTAFSPASLRTIDRYVKRHKIASSDMDYLELLDVARETGKPLIISTGGHKLAEVEHVRDYLDGCDVTWLYCESEYPTNANDPRKMELLQGSCSRIGLSDHSREVFPNLPPTVLINCIEKHVDFCNVDDSPDHPHSLSADEFVKFCSYLRGKHRPKDIVSNGEADMRLRHNRRLVATKDIPKGTALSYNGNYGCYRVLYDDPHGLSPIYAKGAHDRLAARDIKQGQAICNEDLVQ